MSNSNDVLYTVFTAKGCTLNKSFDKDGNKKSNGNMSEGVYETKSVCTIKELFSHFEQLEANQAIALGVAKEASGEITTASTIDKGSAISRTKDNFKFHTKGVLLIDCDPSRKGFVVDSPEELVKALRNIDPKLNDCEIGVRYSSSYAIRKEDVLISKKKSMHAYIIVKSATEDKIKKYKSFLEASAWAKGYGHIEISKSGSLMPRQIFDSAVFSAERLIFEAKPTLAEGITRDVNEPYFSNGNEFRDLDDIDKPNPKGEKIKLEAKELHKDEAQKVKDEYIGKEVKKKIESGIDEKVAKAQVVEKVENKKLLLSDVLTLSDGTRVKVSDIVDHPEKYNGLYIYDPLEPEKGSNKAIINAKDTVNIHSFLHGGFTYNIGITAVAKIKPTQQEPVIEIQGITFPDLTAEGKAKNTIGNLRELLRNSGIVVQYDVILKKTIIQFLYYQNMPETDNMINRQRAYIRSLCVEKGLNIGAENQYLDALIDENSVNPLFYMLENTRWDGVDRLAEVLRTVSSQDEDLYKNNVILKWLIQCIAAWTGTIGSPIPDVLQRYENVLVFVGPQGISKTKFFENILPKEYREYIVTGIHLDTSNKDSINIAISAGITELGELDSTFSKDISRLKAFLSLRSDKFRKPYERAEREHQRRTSFCATVNDDEFLVDQTGNRRFIPLNISAIDFPTYLTIDKIQMWAQVYSQYFKKGYHWWINKELDPQITEILDKKHKEHMIMTSADEIALKVTIDTQNSDATLLKWKTATEIAVHYKLPINGRKNISIIKKSLERSNIAFNSKSKCFYVLLKDWL